MTSNLLKVLFILLIMVLLCRPYIGWVKNSSKKNHTDINRLFCPRHIAYNGYFPDIV